VTTALQLDHEIAESYLGKFVTADSWIRRGRRVAGIARKVELSHRGNVMLQLELPNGSNEWVFLKSVVPEIPQASVRKAR
jgi:hypothetical protein